MDWQVIGIAFATFMVGLILGRSMNGGSVRDAPAPRTVAPVARASGPHKVQLLGIGPNKISVIKKVRGLTNLGLKDALDLVEATPSDVLTGVDRASAEHAVQRLTEAGARSAVA